MQPFCTQREDLTCSAAPGRSQLSYQSSILKNIKLVSYYPYSVFLEKQNLKLDSYYPYSVFLERQNIKLDSYSS